MSYSNAVWIDEWRPISDAQIKEIIAKSQPILKIPDSFKFHDVLIKGKFITRSTA